MAERITTPETTYEQPNESPKQLPGPAINGSMMLMTQYLLVGGAWLLLAKDTRSYWARQGAILGAVWTVLNACNLLVGFFFWGPALPIIAHLNVATTLSLFGCYLCLSVNRTKLNWWDHWFFRVVSVIGLLAVAIAYVVLGSWFKAEGVFAAIALYSSICCWWLRPSCWQTQPGPTFLFGLVPFLLLLLSVPRAFSGTDNYLMLQSILICMLLGVLRTRRVK
jgi:hypothetical protein